MEEKMDEEALSRNKEVCRMLRQSLLEICRDHYTAMADMEVDAIICLSAINSTQQNIVKIHQVVPRENFKNTSITGAPSSKVDSACSLGIARGIQMQIKKRKRLMCRQKHNFRVKVNAGRVDSEASCVLNDTNRSNSRRRKMRKSSVSQYQPWDQPEPPLIDSPLMDTNSPVNTLFVTRDKQGHLLSVSQLCGKHPEEDTQEEIQNGLSPSTEEKLSIKEEPFDNEYGDNDMDGCGLTDKNTSDIFVGKSDSDSKDVTGATAPNESSRRREPKAKFMIYNKELGTVETESQSTDEQEDLDMDEGEKEVGKTQDYTETSCESVVVKTEPKDPEFSRDIENPSMIIQSVQGNSTFEVGTGKKQVSLLRNCLIKTGNNQEVNLSSMFMDNDRNSQLSKFPSDNNSELHYTSPSTSVIDFTGGTDWKKGYSLLGEEKSNDDGQSSDMTPASSIREPAVLRQTKRRKNTEPKLVSLLQKPTVLDVPSSGLVGATGTSQLSPLRISSLDNFTKSNVSSPLNYSSANQSFDDNDPVIRGEMKQFFCEKCGTGFASRKSKMRHEKFTCGNHTFECSVCGKFYSRADSKQRHMLKMHGIKMPSHLGADPFDISSSEIVDDNSMAWL